MKQTIQIISHTNNIQGARPRRPLVQVLAPDPYSGSFSFHPKHAREIARAILEHGKAAKDGRKRQRVTVTLDQDSE